MCFILLEIVTGSFILAILTQLLHYHNGLMLFFGFLAALVPTLAIFPLNTILEVSLYLNTRVQSEHLDLSTLEQELLLDPILVSAMESQPLLARNV